MQVADALFIFSFMGLEGKGRDYLPMPRSQWLEIIVDRSVKA